MANNKIVILSTRPVGKAAQEKALRHHIHIEEIPFIKTEESIDATKAGIIRKLIDQKIAVVFTSMNAVEAVHKQVKGKTNWEIFCIGNTTQKLVNKYFGEKNISGFADNASKLAEVIVAKKNVQKVIFFCGYQRRDELPEELKKSMIQVEEIVVYKTMAIPQNISKQYDAVLFFSPSAVKSFFSINEINSSTKLFAIGETTANEIRNFTQQSVFVADKPGKENLVELAINYFSKSHIL
ncbi:MAG TPA: uroporphyrinogen-III synthase [Hanamia sp.]|nr:uroporphyrinogen-III synthase [Hanamia sp.]